METIPFDDPTDLVAISVESYTARRAYEISEEYRERGVQVILGGMHPTLIPEEAALHADSIFIGDAETVWSQVVADARRRKLQKVYRGPPGIGQIGGVLPRRDLFRGKGYLPVTLLQYIRGCRFTCQFCAVTQYFDRTHYVRQIDDVLREIEAQDRRLFFFVDDNIASHPKALKELCHALIPMRISRRIFRRSQIMSTKSRCFGRTECRHGLRSRWATITILMTRSWPPLISHSKIDSRWPRLIS